MGSIFGGTIFSGASTPTSVDITVDGHVSFVSIPPPAPDVLLQLGSFRVTAYHLVAAAIALVVMLVARHVIGRVWRTVRGAAAMPSVAPTGARSDKHTESTPTSGSS